MSDWAKRKLTELNEAEGVDFCAPGYALGEAVIEALRQAYDQGLRDALEAKKSNQEGEAK